MEINKRNPGMRRLGKSVAWIFAIVLPQGILVHSISWRSAQQLSALPDFRSFPASLEKWTVVNDDPIPKSMLDLLQPDDYLHRIYLEEETPAPASKTATADVFVAYFNSAESAKRPHSPAACLPGSGWIPISSDITQLAASGGDSVSLTRLVLRKESQTIYVLFWYQNDRRTWARESMARLQMIPEILFHQRSELAIVRIATLIDSELDPATASKMDALAVSVRKSLTAVLEAHRPARAPLAAVR